MQKQKGFTIIELIVVIAIIAVLAAIVLVNVTSYINKSKDAAMKANMRAMMTDAAVYYDVASPTYSGLCTDTTSGFATAYGAITSTKACNAIAASWCACAKEVGAGATGYFCVDQKGQAKDTATDCTTTSYCASTTAPVCP